MAEFTKNTPGAPTSGLYSVGDVVTDSVGVRWQAILGGVGGGERFVPYLAQRATAAPISINTAGNVTYTAAQLIAGTIVRDPNGAARSDTLPTAALLVAALKSPKVGQEIETLLINGADAVAESITLNAGAGGAFDANQTAASRLVGIVVAGGTPGGRAIVKIRLTNVTPAAEAYVVYA